MFGTDQTANKQEIMAMGRRELVAYLENDRGIACYSDEPTKLLRECALEDAGYKKIDGRWRKSK